MKGRLDRSDDELFIDLYKPSPYLKYFPRSFPGFLRTVASKVLLAYYVLAYTYVESTFGRNNLTSEEACLISSEGNN